MLVDTHCHIFTEYYDNIDLIIDNCKKNNVRKIIVNGYNMESNKEVLKLAKKYDIVYGALGIQPEEIYDFNEENLKFIEEHITDEKIVAVGEIGLDFYHDGFDKVKQIDLFRRQLDIAERFHKPVIIHSRNCIQETYNILREYNVVGSMHCYSGSVEMAKEFIKLGFKLGIGGICTFKKSKNIIEVIKNIDLEYIILETDSPYLTPEPYRGSTNSPEYIPIIADKIAELKGIKLEEVEERTSLTSCSLFDI